MAADERTVRPGGTISGPAMFMLADVAVYVAILGAGGRRALQAVTTNLHEFPEAPATARSARPGAA